MHVLVYQLESYNYLILKGLILLLLFILAVCDIYKANSSPIGLQLRWHYWTLRDYSGKPTKRTANRPNWKRKRPRRRLKWRMPKELALRRRVWNRWYTWVLLSMGDWALVLHWRLRSHLAAARETCRATSFEAYPIEIFSAVPEPQLHAGMKQMGHLLMPAEPWVGQIVYLYILDRLLLEPTKSRPNSTDIDQSWRYIRADYLRQAKVFSVLVAAIPIITGLAAPWDFQNQEYFQS